MSDELHQLRQRKAAELAALSDRQREETGRFHEEYMDLLVEHGVDEDELQWELILMIREAIPSPREYDMSGLDEEEDED